LPKKGVGTNAKQIIRSMENIKFLTFDTSEAAIGTKGFGMGRGGREMESEGGGIGDFTGRDD
jgi:hypothetical protein